MGLTLNSNEARKADNFSSVLRDSGKYVGIITRAEKLLSKNGVEGFGLSFKSDDGQTANYLDIYTVKKDGEKLRGYNLVQAILCCMRAKTVEEGTVTFEAWDNNERKQVQKSAPGYPTLMGKRIGLVLQRELETRQDTGEDKERLNIVTVFEATTGLSASEILDAKTKPERIDVIAKAVMANPVYDKRKKAPKPVAAGGTFGVAAAAGDADFNDDIPF